LIAFVHDDGGEPTTDALHVEAARIPDRDRLLRELREAGLDASPIEEIEIEVRAGDDDEVFAHVERMILSIGAPFVPIKHEGVIYIRPPLS
jgi:hypothetical protein